MIPPERGLALSRRAAGGSLALMQDTLVILRRGAGRSRTGQPGRCVARGRAGRFGRCRSRLSLVLFPLILGAACGGEDIKPRINAPDDTGTIEGRVLTVGDARWRGRVRAETVGGPTTQRVSSETQVDSTGAYALLVPWGKYYLSTEVEGGVRLFYRAAGPTVSKGDTLSIGVDRTLFHADFPLGGAEVTIDAPGLPEGSGWSCTFFLKDQTRLDWIGHTSAYVSDGRLVFVAHSLPAGTYGLQLRTAWGEEFIADGSSASGVGGSGPAGDVSVTVQAGQMTQAHLALSPPALLSGKVDGAWIDLESLDVPGWGTRPAVCVYGPDSTGYVARCRVDSDGSFRFFVFRPDSIRLALDFGFRRPWWGGATFREATVHRLAPGRETEVEPFTDAAIVLRVEAPAPLATFRAYVTVWDSRQRSLTGPQGWLSGSGNLYYLAGLAPGSVYLRTEPAPSFGREPWLAAWYPGVTSFEQAVPVTLRPGEIVELETPLIRGGVIQGQFASPQADDRNAYVELYAAADTSRRLCSASVSEGERTFRFLGLPDGAFLLRAEFRVSSRRRYRWYAGATWARDADTLRVRDHDTIEIVDWR